jgi:hypothetical protein
MDYATAVADRLPATFAALHAGTIRLAPDGSGMDAAADPDDTGEADGPRDGGNGSGPGGGGGPGSADGPGGSGPGHQHARHAGPAATWTTPRRGIRAG